jgi:hypothetical protein
MVVLIVAVVFRHKNMPKVSKAEPKIVDEAEGMQARTVIYALLGVIIAISALLFVLHWQDEHEIINIRVTDANGGKVDYQAYKMAIEGRRFTTLDGREVTLGNGDRIEMTATE